MGRQKLTNSETHNSIPISPRPCLKYFVTMAVTKSVLGRMKKLALLPLLLSLANCTSVFSLIAPFSDLPAPTGPFSVATRTATWVDSSRDETFTPDADFRKLVVQVWFPVEQGMDERYLPYIDDPDLRLPALAKQLRLPRFLIDHFGGVHSHSIDGENASAPESLFPVILFSHGLSGMRFQNSAIIEELVSHGYVVIAADHSYGANITIFDEGPPAQYRAGKRRALNADFINTIDLSPIHILTDDLGFILDKLQSNPPSALIDGVPMDVQRIGALGHSLGGAAAITAMAMDPRVQAAMVLDGWYAPVPDSIVRAGISGPIYHLGQKQWSDPDNYARMDALLMHSRGDIYKMLVPGTLHTDFTDMPLFTPFSLLIGYTRVKDPIWLNELLRRNTLTFFDVYLKDEPREVLKTVMMKTPEVSTYIFSPDLP